MYIVWYLFHVDDRHFFINYEREAFTFLWARRMSDYAELDNKVLQIGGKYPYEVTNYQAFIQSSDDTQ